MCIMLLSLFVDFSNRFDHMLFIIVCHYDQLNYYIKTHYEI